MHSISCVKLQTLSWRTWERKLGGRLVTLIVEGDVSAVNEAVEAAVAGAIKKPDELCSNRTASREIVKLVELSGKPLEEKTRRNKKENK